MPRRLDIRPYTAYALENVLSCTSFEDHRAENLNNLSWPWQRMLYLNMTSKESHYQIVDIDR